MTLLSCSKDMASLNNHIGNDLSKKLWIGKSSLEKCCPYDGRNFLHCYHTINLTNYISTTISTSPPSTSLLIKCFDRLECKTYAGWACLQLGSKHIADQRLGLSWGWIYHDITQNQKLSSTTWHWVWGGNEVTLLSSPSSCQVMSSLQELQPINYHSCVDPPVSHPS